MGSILRSAAAFGFKQVLAIKGTAALWSPKVVRAGMGAHFGLTPKKYQSGESDVTGRISRIGHGIAVLVERLEPVVHDTGYFARAARALATEPEILLFDEPTSALDPIATASIEELVSDTAPLTLLRNGREVGTLYPERRFYPGYVLVQLPEHVSPQDIFTEYAYFSSYSDSWLAHAKAYTEAMVGRFLGSFADTPAVGLGELAAKEALRRAGVEAAQVLGLGIDREDTLDPRIGTARLDLGVVRPA